MSTKKKEIRIDVLHPWCDETYKGFADNPLHDRFHFVLDKEHPDYVIVTEYIYSNRDYMRILERHLKHAPILIYATGECVSPDINIFDYAVVYDDNFKVDDRCVRTPTLDFHRHAVRENFDVPATFADDILKRKTGFCNFIYSNSSAHPNRDKLFYKLSEYKQVDSLGKHLNNKQNIPSSGEENWVGLSIELKSRYKFSIAAENAMFKGYTSEKLLTSFQAKSIPVYWGNPNVARDFNPKAFINSHDYPNFDAVLEKVKELDNNDDLWLEMINQPRRTKEQIELYHQDHRDCVEFWGHIFDQPKQNAKRTPEGYLTDVYKQWFFKKAQEQPRKSFFLFRLLRFLRYYFTKNRSNNLFAKYAGNLFATDLLRSKKTNIYELEKSLNAFSSRLDQTNELLYKKLNDNDREVLVKFFLKKYANVDVATRKEKKELKKSFLQAAKLLKTRKSVDDVIEIDFLDKKVKYVSPSPLDFDLNNPGELLLRCYDIVHTFWLGEYYKDGFHPKKGQTILDCGAASGDTAIAFSLLYDSPVHSFECGDITALKQNVELNNLSNVIATQTFLYSKTGEYKIGDTLQHTLAIDDYVAQNGVKDIGMIKFDIEGGELEALNGAINTIKAQKPILAIPIYHLKSDLWDIPKFLDDLNLPMEFALKWVEPMTWGVDCCLFVRFVETER